MEWYVLRTLLGKEIKVYSVFKKIVPGLKIIYPRRQVFWRKQGKILKLIKPLFSGYLFVATDKVTELDYLLRKHKIGIAWLIRSGGALVPIFEEEREFIEKLIGVEEIVGVSEVLKSENDFKVIKGPLLGLEHKIKKYSSREQRITIEILIMKEIKRIELQGNISTAGT